MRSILLVVALLAAPAIGTAQGRAGTDARSETIMVTASSVRVRGAPSMQSLSIDEFAQGTVLSLAPEEYHSTDWLGIVLDGRVAFVPRYAVALRTPRLASVPAPEPAVATRPAAAPPRPAPTVAPVTAVNAPVSVASTSASVAPSATLAPSTSVASAPGARAAEHPVERAQDRVPDQGALRETAPASTHAQARTEESPALSARRAGIEITVGLLGSVTPVETGGGLTPELHVAGLSFFGAQYMGWGAYLAPEVGSGGQYRSTMLGGGLSRDLLSAHWFRVTAMAGYTTYARTPTVPSSPSALPERSLRGPSLGGMASVPLFGPLRLGYRGHVIMLQDAGTNVALQRHSMGLLF